MGDTRSSGRGDPMGFLSAIFFYSVGRGWVVAVRFYFLT